MNVDKMIKNAIKTVKASSKDFSILKERLLNQIYYVNSLMLQLRELNLLAVDLLKEIEDSQG